MVGREIAGLSFEPNDVLGRLTLKVEGLSLPSRPGSGRPSLSGLNFQVRAGEVVGVAGLLGAGRTELLEALFGASAEPPRGTILLDGRPVRFRRPDRAIAEGVALVTEDRKTLGLFDRMTVAENITLASLGDVDLARPREPPRGKGGRPAGDHRPRDQDGRRPRARSPASRAATSRSASSPAGS